jgi:hypothetical protein
MTLKLQAVFLSLFLLLSSCAGAERKSNMPEPTAIPFTYLEQSFIAFPMTINGSLTKNFIFDTGIGLNLISKSLCESLGCKAGGSFSGKRMSGQLVTVPTSTLDSLSLGDFRIKDLPIGIFDMDQLMPGADIGGFLSLGFFRDQAVTVDYRKQTITLENQDSLEKLKAEGTVVPVKIGLQGDSLGITLPLELSGGQKINAEVDTGSQALILHERFMKTLGIAADSPNVRRKDGKDETGHEFSRYFTRLEGNVHLPGSPEMGVKGIDAMFQKIIYDGLVGHYFLREFRVTYDLPRSRMIFRKP